jgi:hypothetical protein
MHYGALPKKTSIKGQPHELSYITPQEAGVLRMLGGAGKNVNGVPAYYHTPGHGTSIAAGYGQMADTLRQAPGGAVSLSGKKVGDTKDRKPKRQSEQTIMDLLKANNAKARAEREMAARAEAEKAAATLESGNVSPTSTVQMKDGKVLVSTNVGSGTENTYLDPETYTAMTGYEPPSGVTITSSDNVSSPMLDATKPVDTTGFVEDLMLAGQDIGQLFDPSLGSLMGDEQGARALGSGVQQSYFVPGVALGDPDRGVRAESAADAFNIVDMDRFDNIRPDDPLFDIDPANVLSYDELVARGMVDPITGDVGRQEFMTDGVYGDDVSIPYDYYGAPFGLGYDDNGNLIEIPLGGGITIPGTDIAITAPPTDDGGGGAPPSGGGASSGGGTFPKKRDVYGNPIRLTKGGTSWWKMAANWTNPSERIDTYVTIDEQGNYITSDGKIVPEEIIATALLTPTDIQIKTEIEETQLPYFPRNEYDFQTGRMSDVEYRLGKDTNLNSN